MQVIPLCLLVTPTAVFMERRLPPESVLMKETVTGGIKLLKVLRLLLLDVLLPLILVEEQLDCLH